jgi:flagellar FliL protein
MAKQPTTENAADDAGKGNAPAPAPKGSKKRLLVIGLAVLVLTGAGGAYWVFGQSGHGDDAVAAAKPVAFVDIREMTVNLAPEPNQERQRYLKFRVSLEVKDPKIGKDIQPLLPRVEDAFQVFVRELRASDLEGSAGVYRLREELLRRVNVAVYPAKVDAVLFKDIVIQ